MMMMMMMRNVKEKRGMVEKRSEEVRIGIGIRIG